MITGNEPMQPVVKPGFTYGDGSYEETSVRGGLTIRQYFAIKAMQGLLASGDHNKTDLIGIDERMAISAYSVQMADALINELNK